MTTLSRAPTVHQTLGFMPCALASPDPHHGGVLVTMIQMRTPGSARTQQGWYWNQSLVPVFVPYKKEDY